MEELKERLDKKTKKKSASTDSSINSPHDRLFKSAMSDIRVARDFFDHYLPASIRPHVDLNTLALWPNEHNHALELLSSDVIYTVKIAGETAFLVLLCEHQSTVDALMPLWIWQYIVAIWQEHLKQTNAKTLPLVVPLVFYHGKQPYNGPTDIRDLIQAPKELIEEILFKPFHLIDMHHIQDEILREQEWVGVMAFVMKHIYKKECLTFLHTLIEMLRPIACRVDTSDYCYTLVKYLLEMGDTAHPEVVTEVLRDGLSDGGKKMSIADKLKELGRKEALAEVHSIAEQSKQAGIHTGESNFLLQLLADKFGSNALTYQNRIKIANSQQLLQWMRQALGARNLEEVFKT